MREIVIRHASPEDAAQIFDVRTTTWLSTYPNQRLGITIDLIRERFRDRKVGIAKQRSYLENQDHTHTWVATDDGVVVGFIVASIADGKQQILAAYVLPEYQGGGIGSRLMETALEWIGPGTVEVHVAAYNQQAIDYYAKFRFELIGELEEDLIELPGGKVIPEVLMRREQPV
ncbi:MAG: putative acetyltransferase [candidate division WS6 bacterium OLB20]|uniref:Putative acetyltransferase n=1 Tax=candidate division WS6 bacterium OLB20 TaxID=1617426 RepID=A0A136LZH2_9BACT|nr:MAG: putative acetyltransferase [candidate division WS6 bacterium OLB20]